jgi:methionyl-tRNA formyltransferase
MVPEIDAGPLAYQACFEIGEQEPALQVSARCTELGIQLLLKLLETAGLRQEQIPSRRQDLAQREYFGKGPPQRGWIDWTRPARQVYNFIRACDYYPFPSPWGHPRTELGGQELSIIKAIPTQQPASAAPGAIGEVGAAGALVACGDEWLLVKKVKRAHQIVDASDVFLSSERLKSRHIDPIHPT